MTVTSLTSSDRGHVSMTTVVRGDTRITQQECVAVWLGGCMCGEVTLGDGVSACTV